MSRIEKESERKKGELIQDELTDDALTGKFRVYQRRRGHRFSLDDLLVAAIALETRPDAKRILDLGSGIGSVPLMVAAINQGAAIVCVEAQEVSYRLLVRNIERNDLGDRLGTILGDFRHVDLGDPRFELITGTPPYFKPGEATLPPDSQKAHARFELRGGVEDYLSTAIKYLDRGGAIVVCAASSRERSAVMRVEAIPREGRPPLFTVFAFETSKGPVARERFIARTSDGRTSQQYLALRARFGLYDREQR